MLSAMKTWPSWTAGSTVGAMRRTLPSTSPEPITRTAAGWLTASLRESAVGTRPTRSYSPRAMMENSASPLAEANAPMVALEAEIDPATGAVTLIEPPSGRFSRASVCPAVTVSPASASTSATLSPSRSGRTAVSSRGMTVPDTSTILAKHDFIALITVTVSPLGVSSSAARAGVARGRAAAARAAGRVRKW